MNYLNRPLDDVAQMERQNGRWNNDTQINASKESDHKASRDNRSSGIKRVITRAETGSSNYYRGGGYNNRSTPSYMYKSYAPSYNNVNRKYWAGRYNTRGTSGYYRGKNYDRRDFERRVEHDRGGVGIGIGGGSGGGGGASANANAGGRTYSYRGGRNYYRGGRHYYYRGRKYLYGNYYYRSNFMRRVKDNPSVFPKKPMINDGAVGKIKDGYRKPLIKDSARRIIKETGTFKVPRNTVVSTGINRYNILLPSGSSRFNNLNMSLYRNRNPVFPNTGRGRVGPKPLSLSRRTLVSKSRLRGTGLTKPVRRINDILKGENKIDPYLMSKIKIYTSPENVPPPLTQQLDADVNLPRSLQRRSNNKKED